MHKLAKAALVSVGVGAVLSVIACNSKVAECNKLIDKINASVTAMEKANKAAKPSKEASKEMAEMAKVADQGKKDIESVQLSDEKLKGFQKEFADMYGKFAGASSKMQAAADKEDMPGMTSALNEISALEKEESELVNKANAYCQGK